MEVPLTHSCQVSPLNRSVTANYSVPPCILRFLVANDFFKIWDWQSAEQHTVLDNKIAK